MDLLAGGLHAPNHQSSSFQANVKQERRKTKSMSERSIALWVFSSMEISPLKEHRYKDGYHYPRVCQCLAIDRTGKKAVEV